GDVIIYSKEYIIASNCSNGSYSGGYQLGMYEIKTGKAIKYFDTSDKFNSISLSNDKLSLVCASGEDKNVQIFDINTRKRKDVIHIGFPVYHAELSRDNKKLICSGYSYELQIWDVSTKGLIKGFPIEITFTQSGESMSQIHSFSLSKDRRYIAIPEHYNKQVSIWNVETGECIQQIPCGEYVKYANFNLNNNKLIIADYYGVGIYEFPLLDPEHSQVLKSLPPLVNDD
ncbi:MAG: WD40 repeat domain-containing protein, partial [Burkholderiales bacterium]